MNIIHNIKLSEDSLKYLNEVFKDYKKVEYDTSRVIKNPLVHLYPTHDTIDEYGDLNGYRDALFMTIRIYDVENDIYMEIKNRDGLDFYNSDVSLRQIRIFKDGSTLVMISGRCKFGSSQSIDVWDVQ